MRRRMVSELISLDGVVEASRRRAGPPDTGSMFDDHGPELEAYERIAVTSRRTCCSIVG